MDIHKEPALDVFGCESTETNNTQNILAKTFPPLTRDEHNVLDLIKNDTGRLVNAKQSDCGCPQGQASEPYIV
jgi:phage terminase large subunit-like protein